MSNSDPAALSLFMVVNLSKVGRNDSCPCGSGKKCRRCCGGATVN